MAVAQKKVFWQSKTLWVNALMVLGATLLLATNTFELSPLALQLIMFGYGVVNIGLRTITKDELTK